MSGEKSNFQFILRLLNTNVDGKQKIMYALTKIKGVGRRYSNLVCKKADVDLSKRYAKDSRRIKVDTITDVFSSVLARSRPKSWNALLLSYKTPHSTRYQPGS